MAYKDSDELKTDERYPLGDYSFRIERSSVPGSTNDKIEAICTDKGGKNARKSIQLPSATKMGGWYVEANESEATVYAVVQVPKGDERETDFLETFTASGGPYSETYTSYTSVRHDMWMGGAGVAGGTVYADNPPYQTNCQMIFVSGSPGAHHLLYRWYDDEEPRLNYDSECSSTYTRNGKTVYWGGWSHPMEADFGPLDNPSPPKRKDGTKASNGEIAWAILYGTPTGEYEEKTMMVGRFAIDIEDAGGVGPGGGIGGGWTDPEDYDEDWEEGDPTHTLYVTVTGALSGRHNDPIVDPSYSYIPADKDTVKDYGCGGDGGHGGGGGAGASTVVIHKFATNQANSKEVTAIARRHGYGSGGGKGGKGGDGCILVYY